MNKSRLIITLFAASIISCHCFAQNNPYKIDDRLYGLFNHALNAIPNDNGLKVIDSLTIQAKRYNDVKAECISFFLIGRFYSYRRDPVHLQQAFSRYAPMILKTPYRQYYFGMWGSLITSYLNTNRYDEAVREILKYRKEAFRLNDNFGILHSYKEQGDLYIRTRHFQLALPYYRKALKYIDKDKKDAADLYISLSRCYLYLLKWKDAERTLDLCKSFNENEVTSIIVLELYLILYCSEDEQDAQKIEQTYSLMMKQAKKDKNARKQQLYYDALFCYNYFYKHDYNSEAANSLYKVAMERNSLPQQLFNARMYESTKDYHHAALSYKNICDIIDKQKKDNEHYLFREFVPQLDFYNIDHQKQLLLRRHAAMQLKHLNDEKNLLKLKDEQDRARLITRQHEHDELMNKFLAQRANIEQKKKSTYNEYLKAEQQRKDTEMLNEQNGWKLFFIITISSIVLLALFIYIFDNLKTHRTLKEDKEKALRSEHLKSLFYQNMNHEIRTPLNAISGFNEILNGEMHDTLSPEEKRRFIKMISTNSELLLTLVNDVLDLSNFESGTYKLKLTDVDIHELCYTAVESIRGRQEEGVKLIFDPKGNEHYILHTDGQRLQQVLTNYLTNACKHTTSGSITLSYDIQPTQIRFAVADTGIGIKDEDAEIVFERFQMLQGEKNGTGLGLHICRLIADLLHGSAYLDKSYKKGARFIFDHPIISAILLCFVLMLHPTIHAAGQSQAQINKLDTYYSRLQLEENRPLSLRMCDSLYMMSKKANYVRGECRALLSKTSIYGVLAKTDSMLIAFSQCKELCIKNKEEVPLFLAWSQVVLALLQKGNNQKALEQLSQLKQAATKLHSSYGMDQYYYEAGTYYFLLEQYSAALRYYFHLRDKGYTDTGGLYSMIGQCLYYMGDYKEAIHNMQLALGLTNTDMKRALPIVFLVRCYSLLGDSVSASREVANLRKLNQEGFRPIDKNLYHIALYNYYKFIVKDTAKYISEEKIVFSRSSNVNGGQYHLDIGDDVKANNIYKRNALRLISKMQSAGDESEQLYVSKYDFQEAVAHNDELALSNVQLQLVDARNNQKLLSLQHDKTLWMLKMENMDEQRKQWQITMQNISLMQQSNELERQKILAEGAARQKKLVQNQLEWRTVVIILIILSLGAILGFYIYKLRRKEQHLREEATIAEENEKDKEQFFGNVNKEIRAPLDTIILLNNQLNGDGSSDEIPYNQRMEMLKTLNRSTAYLTEFVNDVLDISKMDSGKLTAKSERTEITSLCKSTLGEVKSMVDNTDIHFVFLPNGIVNYDPMPYFIQSDRNLIQIVLFSYLTAAVHRSISGDIILSYELINNILQLSVVDHASTIPAETAEDMFRFEKNSLSAKNDALKLHKVRLIARILKGRAYIDTTYTEGARFVFELPVKHR
jgi:signal transduction histidine kinase